MYFETFSQMKKTLGQIGTWLDAAVTFAGEKKFDHALYLGFRLAPDQFPLARQVQITCDTAKLGAARLAGRVAPTHEDNEATIEQLQTRLRSVVGYLSEYSAKDFEGADTRHITQPRWAGKIMLGADYFHEHVIPNFYFHATHTYAILRHVGVPLGKRDYLGALSMRDP